MDIIVDSIYQGILFTPIMEWVAVLTSVLYVIFAARERIVCWFFALLTSVLYIYICIDSKLYAESILQGFYFIMAIVGWMEWTDRKFIKFRQEEVLDLAPKKNARIRKWRPSVHLINIAVSGVVAFVVGFTLDLFSDQANPYLDSLITVFSLAATYMVTQRVLENWIYWIVIDIASIYLYYDRGLHLSALLFVFFTILAVIGYFSWRKRYYRQISV